MTCGGCGEFKGRQISGDRQLATSDSGRVGSVPVIITEDVQDLVGRETGTKYGSHSRGDIFNIDSRDYAGENPWVRVTQETLRIKWT